MGWKQGNTPEKRFGTPAFGGGFFVLECGPGAFGILPLSSKRKAALPDGKTAYLARLCIAIALFSEAVSVKREVPFERQ